MFNESLAGESQVAQRDLLSQVIANPESMDENTISRILSQQNQAIGQRASRQAMQAQDRAASLGVGRDIGQREENRAFRQGAQQQNEAERATRIDAAKTNFADRLNTLRGAGGEISRDFGARERAGAGAAGVLANTQDRGEVLLGRSLLSSPETPKIAGADKVNYYGNR